MPDTRPVWLTREIRDYLASLATALHADNEACAAGGQWGGIGHLDALVAAWDAAPANAVEVALIAAGFYSHDDAYEIAHAVLRALEMPND